MSALCERKTDISIIIPVFNLENYITPMLDCLKRQELGKYTAEILIVLNNCTDRTEDVIRQSGLDCTLLSCTVQGCGPARNTALDVAVGDYIWMLDGDDWLLSDTAVHDVLAEAKRNDLDILYIPFASETFRRQYFSMCVQYLLRREFVKEFRFPDYQPSEDDAYMRQVLYKAGYHEFNYLRLPHIDRPLYYYNYGRPGSNMVRHYAGEKI